MTPAEIQNTDFAAMAEVLRAKGEPFAFATVVRTAGSTAAKPGAKALIAADGQVLEGWLGGGCTRGAVKRAALDALASGEPQLVSVAPEDVLDDLGVVPGSQVDGRRFARNGCPSKGSVEIFVEPCLPLPVLSVVGGSPVADALRGLAPSMSWSLAETSRDAIVVATQGQGDLDALKAALEQGASYIAFVGSARKFASLAEKLKSAGVAQNQIDQVRAPAGLRIGAVTPEEIALSILAELVQHRRAGLQRVANV